MKKKISILDVAREAGFPKAPYPVCSMGKQSASKHARLYSERLKQWIIVRMP